MERAPREWQERDMVYRPLRYEQMMQAAEAFDGRARRMFGGMGVYTGEKMFAFLLGEDIGLKLAPEDVEAALAIPGAGPMKPDQDAAPLREYVRMPKEILDNYETFMFWVERSANYARKKNGTAAGTA
jgi:TfoX/Sxy family transcriptional regulator of competence genes